MMQPKHNIGPRRRPKIRTLHRGPSSNSNGAPQGTHQSTRPPMKRGHRDRRRARPTHPMRHGRPLKRERRPESEKKAPSSLHLPGPGENLRIIPLGGYEEIGKNMTAIEYKDDIVIIDAGLMFSETETPGIDYIIPDVTYLEDRKDKIRGVFVTHGHYDHIGAIPHIMGRLGNPPIYTREFGGLIIKKRQSEFAEAPPMDLRIVEGTERIKAGKYFTVRFFELSHAIRDSMGIIVESPVGKVAILTDVRVDHKDGVVTEEEVERYKFFKDEDILLFMLDSTSVEYPGFSTPESEAIENVGKIMKRTKGRVVIGAFSSQVERIMQFITIADSLGRKVAINGRSMKDNVGILKELGLIKTKNMIPIEEIGDHPEEKIVVITTGAQGEEHSGFDLIANKKHKHIKLTERDTIILSSSVVPGNELSVQKLKDNLYRSGAKIISYREEAVHASGHGKRGELEWIHKQINYRFFMPMHGHHYMLRIHTEVSETLKGTPRENLIVADDGSLVEISPDGKKVNILKDKAPAETIMVDGFSVGGTKEVVIRDRQMLAEDGMFIVVASIDPRTGKLRKSPDIVSRGFVYLREEQQLLNETRAIIKRTVENTTKGMHPINFEVVKNAVTDEVRKHLFQRTAKSPMVIPVVIGV